MSSESFEPIVGKWEEFTYFDNLALWYVCNEAPPRTLALAFLEADEKVCGSLLGVVDPKRREYIHRLMAAEKDASEDAKSQAIEGLFLIAEGLISRKWIRKEGRFYFGQKKS